MIWAANKLLFETNIILANNFGYLSSGSRYLGLQPYSIPVKIILHFRILEEVEQYNCLLLSRREPLRGPSCVPRTSKSALSVSSGSQRSCGPL